MIMVQTIGKLGVPDYQIVGKSEHSDLLNVWNSGSLSILIVR